MQPAAGKALADKLDQLPPHKVGGLGAHEQGVGAHGT
jgi:hypothetical protein